VSSGGHTGNTLITSCIADIWIWLEEQVLFFDSIVAVLNMWSVCIFLSLILLRGHLKAWLLCTQLKKPVGHMGSHNSDWPVLLGDHRSSARAAVMNMDGVLFHVIDWMLWQRLAVGVLGRIKNFWVTVCVVLRYLKPASIFPQKASIFIIMLRYKINFNFVTRGHNIYSSVKMFKRNFKFSLKSSILTTVLRCSNLSLKGSVFTIC